MIQFIELVPRFVLNENYQYEKDSFINGKSMIPPEQYHTIYENREIMYDFPHATFQIEEEIKVMGVFYEVVAIGCKEFSTEKGFIQKIYIKLLN